MPLISIVVPCFNEEESLPLFMDELERVAGNMISAHADLRFETVLVNDGSRDGTLGVMRAEAARGRKNIDVRWISFSRNFGKEAALYAGLEHARGDYVATMDADMQDPPSLLPQMYEALLAGEFDNVATRRVSRDGEPPVRSFFARMFYRIINRISKTEIVDGARDFRLMSRAMVDAVLSMGEYNRFSKGIYGWVGFKTKWIPYVNVNRVAGETKWSFWKLTLYALDGIVAFSTAPLAVASVAGLICFLVAIVALVFVVVRAAIWGDPVSGWPSLVCIILLIGGLQLLCLGIIGQYLAKTYMEVKRRPIYIVQSSSDSEKTPAAKSCDAGSQPND